jgi:hypothetical protein
MSKGPGRIERAIESLFIAQPDSAFTSDELCLHAYPNLNPSERRLIQRKHAVSVIRAAKKVCARMPDWTMQHGWGRGGLGVFLNRASLASFAVGSRKAQHHGNDTEGAKASIEPGMHHHKDYAEGGWGWRRVQLYIADRDGDTSEQANDLRRQDNADCAGFNLPPRYPDSTEG